MANVSFRADVFFCLGKKKRSARMRIVHFLFLGHEFDIFYMDMIFCKKKIEYYDVKML